MRKWIVDTDTASDDAVALIMALQTDAIQLKAITVVAGNVELDQGVQNALYCVELCKRNVPVYAGLAKPILRDLSTAQFVHGADGMGDIGLDLSGRKPAPGHAIDVIIETIKAAPGEIELVTLGPLSNIAVALLKQPSIAKKVKCCHIMGAVGQGPGNITAVSEYNIWVDPEAAQIVFNSEMPIRIAGWDIAVKHAYFNDQEIAAWKQKKGIITQFSLDIQRGKYAFNKKITGKGGFELPDPIAVAMALDETMITQKKTMGVEVVLGDGPTRGQVIIDHINVMPDAPKVEVVLEVDTQHFKNLLFSLMAEKD
ncbi:MAG: nucleoside hydrolase [Bacteroidota bacterium]